LIPKATTADIARVAGVSTATVSRALSANGVVAVDVRHRLQEAANVLGYRPLRPRRNAGRKPWVVVLTDSAISAFFSQVLMGIHEQAAELGWLTFIVQMKVGQEHDARILKQLQQHAWLGIISARERYIPPEEWVQLHQQLQTPLALFNVLVEHAQIASLRANLERAVVSTMQHILDIGHARIAYLGVSSNEYSAAELRGVEQALSQGGYSYPEGFRISASHTPKEPPKPSAGC